MGPNLRGKAKVSERTGEIKIEDQGRTYLLNCILRKQVVITSLLASNENKQLGKYSKVKYNLHPLD